MKLMTAPLYVVLIVTTLMSFDLMALKCSKKITRFWGLGNCDDRIAHLMKCATKIVDGKNKKNKKYYVEEMRQFNDYIIRIYPGLSFDTIVRVFDDLNKNGVKNGTCKIARDSVWGCSYPRFCDIFFGNNGDGYYNLISQITTKKAEENLSRIERDLNWKKSLENSSYLNDHCQQ